MPPKRDPYATPVQKSVDLLLIVLTILVIAFAFYSARQQNQPASDSTSPTQSQTTFASL